VKNAGMAVSIGLVVAGNYSDLQVFGDCRQVFLQIDCVGFIRIAGRDSFASGQAEGGSDAAEEGCED